MLTCSNYVDERGEATGFWDCCYEPGLSWEPPECGHEFTPDPDDDTTWVVCPKCGGDVDREAARILSEEGR